MTVLDDPGTAQDPRGLRPRELAVVAAAVAVLLVVGVAIGLVERQRRSEALTPAVQAEQMVRATCETIWDVPLTAEGLTTAQAVERMRTTAAFYDEAQANVEAAAALDPVWLPLAGAVAEMGAGIEVYATVLATGDQARIDAAVKRLRAEVSPAYDQIVADCRALRQKPVVGR